VPTDRTQGRIIITGGTGLIGRALSERLVADQYEVVVLTRDPTSATDLPAGVKVVGWDARTADGWLGLAHGALGIVNLAGASLRRRWTERNKRLIRESRLNAGDAVVDAVARAESKPRVVIQASGTGAYGPRGDEIVTEEADFGDGFLGRTARAWEASTEPVEMHGVRRAVIRSGVVLSSDGGALPLLALPHRLFVGGPLGTGDQWLPWIHMGDEVRAIRFLIENEDASGPYNLSAPNPVKHARFSSVLGRVLHRPSTFRVPGFLIRLVLGEMSTVVLKGQCAIPQRLLNQGFSFRFPELEPALEDVLG
jgi:hypothetical protein